MGGMVAVWVGDAQRTSESAIFDMSLTKAIKSPVKFSSLHLRNCGQAKWSPARSNACGRQGVKRRGTYLLFKVGPVLFAERFIQHALCAVDTGHQSCQKRSHGGHTCPPPPPHATVCALGVRAAGARGGWGQLTMPTAAIPPCPSEHIHLDIFDPLGPGLVPAWGRR